MRRRCAGVHGHVSPAGPPSSSSAAALDLDARLRQDHRRRLQRGQLVGVQVGVPRGLLEEEGRRQGSLLLRVAMARGRRGPRVGRVRGVAGGREDALEGLAAALLALLAVVLANVPDVKVLAIGTDARCFLCQRLSHLM